MSPKTSAFDRTVGTGADVTGRKGKRRQRFLHAFKQYLGIFFYLWVVLGLLVLHETIVLAKYHISFAHWGVAVTTAFVLAKVMLILEELDVARGFKERPLVYPIVYKSVVFAALLIAFYTAEEIGVGLWRGKTLPESIPSIGGGTPQGILATGLIVSLALVPYFAYREVGRALDEGELRALLFKRGRKAGTGGEAAPSTG
jgi:hypothetical protein